VFLPVLMQGSHRALLHSKFKIKLPVEFCGEILVPVTNCFGDGARSIKRKRIFNGTVCPGYCPASAVCSAKIRAYEESNSLPAQLLTVKTGTAQWVRDILAIRAQVRAAAV
jgi:hypothetical protein